MPSSPSLPLWIFRASARGFAQRKTTLRAAVVIIANQVLHSLRFLPINARGAALVPAADSVAWRFQTPGSAS
jgi:hypothetical protein